MEKQITNDQERLLSLQERCSFFELTTEEKQFVLKNSSKEEFNQFHVLLSESKNLYSIPTPRSLVLPVKGRNHIISFLVPLTSAAAAAILTFFIFRKETIVFQEIEKPVYLTADTVFIHNGKIDTPVKTVIVKEKVQSNQKPLNYSTIELSTQKNNKASESLPLLDLKNAGQSASEDNTIALIEGVSL